MASVFVVGVAVLSIGSDLPELAIAVDAAIKNLNAGEASDLVVGSALVRAVAETIAAGGSTEEGMAAASSLLASIREGIDAPLS